MRALVVTQKQTMGVATTEKQRRGQGRGLKPEQMERTTIN
jgi:hypothetical protein